MANNLSDKFNFFVPASFEKASETGQMKISGICSTIAEDSDEEILEPSGFDFKPLLEKGFYNWNHQANKSSGAILGRPTLAKVINGGRSFYTEGFLYKGVDEAKRVFDLAKALQEEDPERQLGFSIEGQAITRDPINPKRITKARITGIAITHCPKNPNTLLSIIKGEYSEPFIEDDETEDEKKERLAKEEREKSMGTGNVPMPESVEGKPKKQVEDDVILTKSNVYDRIFSTYTTEIEKSNQIYTFIDSVTKKLFKMENITEDSLKKAFELLDTSIVKGGEGEEKKTPEDYDKKDELMKNEEEGKESASHEKEETKEEETEEETTTTTTVAVEKSETTETEVKKSEEVVALEKLGETLQKSFGGQEELFKSLTSSLDSKFGALGQILKSQSEREEKLISQNDELKKSFEALESRLENVENEGVPAKSARSVKAIERFEKSETTQSGVTTYHLSKAEDRRAISNILFEEVATLRNSGRDYSQIEKAIQDLEITKSLNTSMKPVFQRLGVNVVINPM